ncbi:MAG: hypothetical protein N3G20_09725, partial [Verrucomicrobiae bacterium]|nr:hypothetical protein [Verrucomicrobiae bacterium]
MKIAIVLVVASALGTTTGNATSPVEAVFRGHQSEHTWKLNDFDPALPSDWTGYEFLVLEFKTSSSQRFDLGLETSTGRITKRIGPFANVWVRAAIPLRFYRQPAGEGFDMAATYNQPRGSYWINIHTSSHGPLTNVTGITVAMDRPVGTPRIQIRSATLASTDPGDAVLDGKPLIDEFGQY